MGRRSTAAPCGEDVSWLFGSSYMGFCMRGWFGVEDVGTDCCCLWWFLDVMGARIVSGVFFGMHQGTG